MRIGAFCIFVLAKMPPFRGCKCNNRFMDNRRMSQETFFCEIDSEWITDWPVTDYPVNDIISPSGLFEIGRKWIITHLQIKIKLSHRWNFSPERGDRAGIIIQFQIKIVLRSRWNHHMRDGAPAWMMCNHGNFRNGEFQNLKNPLLKPGVVNKILKLPRYLKTKDF